MNPLLPALNRVSNRITIRSVFLGEFARICSSTVSVFPRNERSSHKPARRNGALNDHVPTRTESLSRKSNSKVRLSYASAQTRKCKSIAFPWLKILIPGEIERTRDESKQLLPAVSSITNAIEKGD